MANQLVSAATLSRRTADMANNGGETLSALATIVPYLRKDIYLHMDLPSVTLRDPDAKELFVACEYNRIPGTRLYRSPWTECAVAYETNSKAEVQPDLPTSVLRPLEVILNDVFKHYRQLYYDTGASSVYLWEITKGSPERFTREQHRATERDSFEITFAVAILIRKEVHCTETKKTSVWDSIHTIEISDPSTSSSATYKLNSTIILSIQSGDEKSGQSTFGYTIRRSHEQKVSMQRSLASERSKSLTRHVATIGTMVENMENSIRQSIEHVTAPRLLRMIVGLRTKDESDEKLEFQREMAKTMSQNLMVGMIGT